jgi:UDP-3-O-[3-hydroxymyristoyl] glucosamine N-acyltransferase
LPRTSRPVPLAELASCLGVGVEGDPGFEIGGFGSLAQAGPDELAFLRDVRDASLQDSLRSTRAAAVLLPPGLDREGRHALRSDRPATDFSRLIQIFAPAFRPDPGIAAGAHVDASAEVDPSAAIGPGAVVGPRCRIGPRSIVAAQAVLVADVVVGSDCWIHAGVVLREETRIGNHVVLQPGVVIGGNGFGYVPDERGRPVAMAQRGRVVIEDEVEIGANTTVDRATLDETRIRRGAKIDNLVQIAHNCDIGEDALIVAQTGLSGGTVVGRGAIVMAQSGATGHLRIGARAFVGARTGLHRDVADGARVFGAPQMEERTWHRAVAALKRLPELVKRVRRLERELEDRGGNRGPIGGDSEGR